MSNINSDVYARVREKVKELNLSESELRAIDSARGQLQRHTYGGGFLGVTAAYLIGKKKRLNPLPLFAVSVAGFLFGSQMGVVSGALAGVKTISNLPNSQRLVDVMKEVQMEIIQARQQQQQQIGNNRETPIVTPRNGSNQELEDTRDSNDQFSSGWESEIKSTYPEVEKTAESGGAWDKIREKSAPTSSWSRIRAEAQQVTTDGRVPQEKEFPRELNELPRTREEMLEKSSSRKNQWGDTLE